jgi:hypothetical protein
VHDDPTGAGPRKGGTTTDWPPALHPGRGTHHAVIVVLRALSALEEPCGPPPPVTARLAINARPVARNIGLQPGVARDDSGRPNRQLAASASQKNGNAKHPRPAARNDTLPLW